MCAPKFVEVHVELQNIFSVFVYVKGEIPNLCFLVSVHICVLVSRPNDDPSLGVETICHIR
jgi:hypothetical protein